MARIQGYKMTGRFTVECRTCGGNTTRKYARKHGGRCKFCIEGTARTEPSKVASREEQHARYLDCGPLAWDDRD